MPDIEAMSSDSDTDVSLNLSDSSSSSGHSLSENEDEPRLEIALGSFVHVKLPSKTSHNYIASIILMGGEDDVSVRYHRKRQETTNAFKEGPPDDISAVDKAWIVKGMDAPQITHRGGYVFEDLDTSLKWE